MPHYIPTELDAFLKNAIDFNELIAELSFVEESAVQAAVQQPMLFIKASRLRVQCMRERARCEAALERTKSEVEMENRKRYEGVKTNEAHFKAMLAVDEQVLEAQKAVRRAEAYEETSKLLLEAYRHRRDAIKIVAEANIIEGNSPYTDAKRFGVDASLAKQARSAARKHRLAESTLGSAQESQENITTD